MYFMARMGSNAKLNSYTGMVISASFAVMAVFLIFLGRIGDQKGGWSISVNSAARVPDPILGVSISTWIGARLMFGISTLFYMIAGAISANTAAPITARSM